MGKIINYLLIIICLSSCKANTVNKNLSNFSKDVPLSYFKKLDKVQNLNLNRIDSLRKISLQSMTDIDSVKYTCRFIHSDGPLISYYRLFENLYALHFEEGDMVVDLSYLYFFKYDNDSLVDVTDKVFPKVNFDFFYKCDYMKDSLKDTMPDHLKYFSISDDSSKKITTSFNFPDDYYDEIFFDGFDEKCIDNKEFYFQYNGDKYVQVD